MKNLKVYGLTVLIGISSLVFTGCGTCDIEGDHDHIYVSKKSFDLKYDSCDAEIDGYNKNAGCVFNDSLGKFLIDNNLYKLSDVKDFVKNRVKSMDRFIEVKVVVPYVNNSGKLEFDSYWRMLDNNEIDSFSAYGREGSIDDLEYIVCTVEKDGDQYKKVSKRVKEIDSLDDSYYIDFDNYLNLDAAEKYHFVDGKPYIRTE